MSTRECFGSVGVAALDEVDKLFVLLNEPRAVLLSPDGEGPYPGDSPTEVVDQFL